MSIRAGVKGIENILSSLGMTRKRRSRKTKFEPFVAYNSAWVRASASGLVRDHVSIGDKVQKGQVMASVGDAFGEVLTEVTASKEGIVIGKQNIPLVQEGDAMFHIAYFKDTDEVTDNIEEMQDTLLGD